MYGIRKLGLITFLALIGLSGCSGSSSEQEIGAILPLSGGSAFLGEEERRGIEAMRVILEEELGRPFVLRYEDSKNAATSGIAAFQKLTQLTNVDGLIVTHSGVAGPISDYIGAEEAQGDSQFPATVATVVASTKITQNNQVFLRAYPSGIDEGSKLATFARENADVSEVAILYQNDDYGLDASREFSNSFTALGGEIVYSDAFGSKATDQRSIVAKALAASPDAIFVVGNTPAYANVFKVIREAGFDGRVLSGSAMDVGSLRKLAGEEAVRGVAYSSTFTEGMIHTQNPRYMELKVNLQSAGTSPNMLNMYAAASLEIIADAISKEKLGGSELVARLANAEVSTVLGNVWFRDRNLQVPLYIKRINGLVADEDTILQVMD